MNIRFLLPVILIPFLFINGCAINPVTGQPDLVLLSEKDELALGRKTNQKILKQYRVYDNPALQKYVQDIGSKLAAKSHRSHLAYQFTLLDSKDVNAFALPGGYIYISRGLMAYLKSEAELAAVLGHEIGHVTARHSVRQYSTSKLTDISLTLGAVLIPGMNQSTSKLAQLFGTALLRGYGREHELEADRLGAEYLARSNYAPDAMLDVISVLKDQEVYEHQIARLEGREPRTYHGVFSTHPDNDTRLQTVIGTAQALSDSTKNQSVGHEKYMSQIDNMVFGDNPQGGILRDRHFFHSELNFAISFPIGWSVNNQPEMILLVAPGGEAIIQISTEDIKKETSPRDFMIQRMGLKNLDNEAALNINGFKAHTGISVINSSQGQRPTRFTVIYFDQRAYIIAGASKVPANITKFDSTILNTAKSFHELTISEKKLATPLRLNVIQADKKTRFTDLAEQSPLKANAAPQLRLLNGKYPDGEPREGELLKVIQ